MSVMSASDKIRIAKATAQVAVESIINMPDAFDRSTMVEVITFATDAGVAEFYLDMLRTIIEGTD